jgi:hypothetical protein
VTVRIIAFPLDGEGSALAEVDAPELEGGSRRSMRPGEVAEHVTQTFQEAVSGVRPIAQAIIGQLRAFSDPPSQVAAELGSTFTTTAGVVLASTAVEGSCR